MRRGPKPQPDAIRSQKAAIRSRRSHDESALAAAPLTPRSPIAAPSWLKRDARVIWDRLAGNLSTARLLTELDALAFARYCRSFSRWLKAQRAIDKEGETYESESQWGKLKRINPAFLIADRLERQLLAAEDRFGLNPAERQRIFAARASTSAGGLFDMPRSDADPAAKPVQPAEPIAEKSPVGMLN